MSLNNNAYEGANKKQSNILEWIEKFIKDVYKKTCETVKKE